jgi:hypothetical protein
MLVLATTAVIGGCAPEARTEAAPACRILQMPREIEGGVPESSGLALSSRDPELVWTHNDSGREPEIHAIRPTGAEVGVVRIAGAENRDWEAAASGQCPSGACLFIGDFGDNEAGRDDVAIYRVAEPDSGAGTSEPAKRFPFSYPGGPRDAEGMIVLPDGEVYVLSKGRTSGIALYRFPQPMQADQQVELELIIEFTEDRADLAQQVTGASATPDGEWVAIRSYSTLMLHRTERLLAGDAAPAAAFPLAPVGEPQGEGVAILDNGRVVLTSEGGEGELPGLISVLACSLPRSD